ncbi:MAG: nicotinate-nucleotide adenylyltransferase [Pseudomonadota bacterium]|nr:nicotinate-nucleotide adenylyltransferase [Pseudomonadota bacterium]
MLIGILGGTFDPIHAGHIHVATYLLKHRSFDEVRIIPCFSPVHREQPVASAHDRLAMITLALEQRPNIIIDTREIDREGPSFMIDTLKSLRNDFPNESLGLILGDDAFAHFDHWKDWQDIVHYCHLIIVHRPNSDAQFPDTLKLFIDAHHTTQENALHERKQGNIYFCELPPLPISATEIRQKLAHKEQNIAGLLPQVRDYIRKKGLYLNTP